VAHVAHISS